MSVANYVSIRFGYFNDAYARIAKFDLEDVQGKDVFEVWPETEQKVGGCVSRGGDHRGAPYL